jgi:hypothetical protein
MPDAAQSFADLLTVLLDDWKKFVKFLVLLFFTCVFAFGLVYGVLRSLPRSTSELKFGSGSILFSQPTKDGQEYVVVIPPQGWQETGISVREGDHVSFEAGGRVNIDLEGLNLALAARHDADSRIIDAEKKSGRWEKEKDNFAPELYYTAEDKQNVRPHWRWIDPNGLPETKQLANPAHQKRSILPDKGYGALLAAIRETGVQPGREDAFFVGASNTIVAKRSGKLYFVVNDVTYDDKDFPDMFMIDNIGFFYARVSISK